MMLLGNKTLPPTEIGVYVFSLKNSNFSITLDYRMSIVILLVLLCLVVAGDMFSIK